jgi:hypothetical protein
LRRAAAFVAAAVLASPLVGCGDYSRQDVREAIEQISSIGAEGSLMAGDLARNRTKTTYVRVHGDELSSQAEHEAEKLSDGPTDPAVHDRVDKAIALSSQIGGAIDDLRVSPNDHKSARQAQQDLKKWSDEARKIADSL